MAYHPQHLEISELGRPYDSRLNAAEIERLKRTVLEAFDPARDKDLKSQIDSIIDKVYVDINDLEVSVYSQINTRVANAVTAAVGNLPTGGGGSTTPATRAGLKRTTLGNGTLSGSQYTESANLLTEDMTNAAWVKTATSPDVATTTYSYDAVTKLTSITSAHSSNSFKHTFQLLNGKRYRLKLRGYVSGSGAFCDAKYSATATFSPLPASGLRPVITGGSAGSPTTQTYDWVQSGDLAATIFLSLGPGVITAQLSLHELTGNLGGPNIVTTNLLPTGYKQRWGATDAAALTATPVTTNTVAVTAAIGVLHILDASNNLKYRAVVLVGDVWAYDAALAVPTAADLGANFNFVIWDSEPFDTVEFRDAGVLTITPKGQNTGIAITTTGHISTGDGDTIGCTAGRVHLA